MRGEMAETIEEIITDARTDKLRIWQSTMTPLRNPYTGEIIGLVGVSRDITEARQAEQALAESEAWFRNMFAYAAVGIAIVGSNGRWLQVNRRLCEMLGYTEAELRARTFQDLAHPDDLEANLANVHRLLNAETMTYSTEKRYIRKDGSSLWGNLTVSVLRDAGGRRSTSSPSSRISPRASSPRRSWQRARRGYRNCRPNCCMSRGSVPPAKAPQPWRMS